MIGLGNTGAEIAVDLMERRGAFVAASVRTSPPVVPRDSVGVPVQLFGIALSRVSATLADRIGTTVARVALADLTRYGLPAAQWFSFSAKRIPVIDVGYVENLQLRAIAQPSHVFRQAVSSTRTAGRQISTPSPSRRDFAPDSSRS